MANQQLDALITGATIITMDSERRIFANGALAINGTHIVDIGPTKDIEEKYTAKRTIDGRDFIITPGFINGHVHITGDPLTRGFMPDTIDYRDNDQFLKWVLPRYFAHTPQDEYVSAKLAAHEMLRCGITCFLEAGTIRNVDEAAAGLTEMGIRARIGVWTEGRPHTPDEDPAQTTRSAIQAMEKVIADYPKEPEALLVAWPLLVGHNTNTDDVWRAAKSLADKHGLGISAHMSPYISDTKWYEEHTGKAPLEHLNDLGVLGNNVTLTHLAHLSDNELSLLIESGTNAVFCPLAALKGAFGISNSGRFPEMAKANVNIALGTDGYDCDIMRLMPLASGIFKDMHEDFSLFSAHSMLEMVTVNGAKALGMSDEIGALEAGKKADFICHDINRPELRPLHNPVNQLVWSADGRGIHSVWVNGECLIENYRSTRFDEKAFYHDVQKTGEDLIKRADLPLVSPWPIIS